MMTIILTFFACFIIASVVMFGEVFTLIFKVSFLALFYVGVMAGTVYLMLEGR